MGSLFCFIKKTEKIKEYRYYFRLKNKAINTLLFYLGRQKVTIMIEVFAIFNLFPITDLLHCF